MATIFALLNDVPRPQKQVIRMATNMEVTVVSGGREGVSGEGRMVRDEGGEW
jgi:hypothetical protein